MTLPSSDAAPAEIAAEMEVTTISPTANERTVSPVAVEPSIHIAVTGTVTFFVGILFAVVYFQLCMVIYYGYRLLSYQTILLFDILLWAALRLTLYSFYFYHCCELVGRLSLFSTWLLVAFPSALQFITLAILVHYFGENLYRVYERRKEMSTLAPSYKKLTLCRIFGWLMWLGSIFSYFVCNIVFSVLIHLNSLRDPDGNPNPYLVVLRVATLDGLFLLMGITLAVCMLIMYGTKLGKDVLEAHNVNKWKPITFSCVLFLLFVSRAIYDLISVTITVVNKEEMHAYGFGSSWMATDMADYEFRRKYGYVSYLSILFLWEVIPTYVIVVFFQVAFPFSSCKKLAQCTACRKKPTASVSQSRHFFNNPARYDAETENIIQRSSQLPIPHFSGPVKFSPSQAGYGSTTSCPYSTTSKYSTNNAPSLSYMPGTTPPQLFTRSPSFIQ